METNEGTLTPQQAAAVAMVLEGKSDGEISQLLKMRRQTVKEWRNHHTAFKMEVKQRREQAWKNQQEKLSQLVCPVPGQLEAARHGYLRVLLMQNASRKGAGHAGGVPGAPERAGAPDGRALPAAAAGHAGKYKEPVNDGDEEPLPGYGKEN